MIVVKAWRSQNEVMKTDPYRKRKSKVFVTFSVSNSLFKPPSFNCELGEVDLEDVQDWDSDVECEEMIRVEVWEERFEK